MFSNTQLFKLMPNKRFTFTFTVDISNYFNKYQIPDVRSSCILIFTFDMQGHEHWKIFINPIKSFSLRSFKVFYSKIKTQF